MKALACVLGLWQGAIFLFTISGLLEYKFWLHTGAPVGICLLAYILEEKE